MLYAGEMPAIQKALISPDGALSQLAGCESIRLACYLDSKSPEGAKVIASIQSVCFPDFRPFGALGNDVIFYGGFTSPAK